MIDVCEFCEDAGITETEEYCHRCRELCCSNCLSEEWCPTCLKEHWDNVPDAIKYESIRRAK